MVSTPAPADVVRAVASGVCRLVAGDLDPAERDRQLDELAAHYAPHTDVRHPFAPTGDTPLRTPEALREHFAGAGAVTAGVERFEVTNSVVHLTTDPELVVFEFSYRGAAHGREFEVPCIFVVRVRDGRIVESRDYSDHIGLFRAFGRLDTLVDHLRDEAAADGSPSEAADEGPAPVSR